MTFNPPPSDTGDSDSGSVFDDFINRSLDLDGLEAEGGDDVAGSGLQFHSDSQGRVFLELPGPGSMPHLKPRLDDGPPRGVSTASPRMPYEHDARWAPMMMRRKPGKLRVHQARVSFNSYSGQVILSLPARASRLITVIPEVRPGWTAIRYLAGCKVPAEFIEWRDNRAAIHQLQVGLHTVNGYVRSDEMPALRPARRWEQWARSPDFGLMLFLFAGLLAFLLLLGARLPLGGDPAIAELQQRIDTLQEQVTMLETQLEAGTASTTP